MPTVKYRALHPNLTPRRPKLDVPGWAGQPQPRADGSHEQPWHCIPFSEAARAGFEVPYPWPDELRVSLLDGGFLFATSPDIPPDRRPPFRSFGHDYYTCQLLLDLKADDGFAVRIEPHPRFYTDATGTVPIAVPAVLRPWWPMIAFVVFKAPSPGQTHIFRPGEPMLQVTVVQPDLKCDLLAMSDEEAAEREVQSRRIHASRDTLAAGTTWLSATDTVFDGTYRHLFSAAHGAARK